MSASQKTGLAPKHQRLILVVLALVVLIAAGMLAAWGLRAQADYFYLPEDVTENPPRCPASARSTPPAPRGASRAPALVLPAVSAIRRRRN